MTNCGITRGPRDLASPNCAVCNGTGEVIGLRPAGVRACRCVSRAMFRICWQRQIFHPGMLRTPTDAEYAADLVLSARRELGKLDWEIFRLFFMEGLDWIAGCGKLGLERGFFYHRVYRIQEILGNAWAQLQPYALYPPDKYFVRVRSAAA